MGAGRGFGFGRAMGRAARVLLVLALLLGMFVAIGYHNARADPVVRRMTVRLPHWPASAPPVRVALLSDIHIGSGAMNAARLERIVAQVDALRPDLVLLAGDFVSGHDPVRARGYALALTRPLAGLHAPLGVVAVLGNHDHWTDAVAISRALAKGGITVLANTAVERGPIAVIGIDDGFTGHADVAASLAAGAVLPGAPIVMTHTPDTAALLPLGGPPLVLAGHTHCGQAVFPLVGPVVINSPKLGRPLYDPRYICGAVRDPGRLVIVTGGLGASLPLRFAAPPDLWLLTLGP